MAMTITIDGSTYEVNKVHDYGELPMIEAEGRMEFYIARSSAEAGKAARQHWKDMAENDKSEFRSLVGDDALVAWALGEWGGPGSTKTRSLKEWLDLHLNAPEEHFAGYDSEELTVEKVSTELRKALGFTPKVAYRHN
jgi:hypothetical protein